MAPALSTTKRKFHKILDSISNASTPSLVLKEKQNENGSATTLPANLDRPAKKPRITRPNSAIVLSTTFHAGKQAPKTAKPSFSSATMNEDRKPPNFAPWDRAQFLERLKTFRQVDKWMGMPEKINEVQWAKRGWSCVGKERVGCVGGCGKEVVIKLEEDRLEEECAAEELSGDEDQDWREHAQMQLIEKYSELIIKEHDGGCLWRRRGCDGKELFDHNVVYADVSYRYYTSASSCSSHNSPNQSLPSLRIPRCDKLVASVHSFYPTIF